MIQEGSEACVASAMNQISRSLWFCHFPEHQMLWYFLSDGMQNKGPHLKDKLTVLEDGNCYKTKHVSLKHATPLRRFLWCVGDQVPGSSITLLGKDAFWKQTLSVIWYKDAQGIDDLYSNQEKIPSWHGTSIEWQLTRTAHFFLHTKFQLVLNQFHSLKLVWHKRITRTESVN